MNQLWEVLVPTQMMNPRIDDVVIRPIRTRYHRVWDAKVRAITGGLTVLPPNVGQWVGHENNLFIERMIPVRIACTEQQINQIIDMTLDYYNQEAVFAYLVSERVIIKYRHEKIPKA